MEDPPSPSLRPPRGASLREPGSATPGRPIARRGFSHVELLVVIGILIILGGIVFAVVNRTRKSAATVSCTNQLRQIGLAFRSYADSNWGRLPDPFQNQASWESSLKPHIGGNDDVFRCPSDTEIAPAVGSSYDWRDTGKPATTLAGRTIDDSTRPNAILALEALPGWHEKLKINTVALDGSVATMDHRACFADLAAPIR